MIQILKMHREDVHQPAAPAPATPAIKIERLPRPVFSLNMSEAAWQFKVIKWRSYINQTPPLQTTNFSSWELPVTRSSASESTTVGTATDFDTENTFLARMKELNIIKHY